MAERTSKEFSDLIKQAPQASAAATNEARPTFESLAATPPSTPAAAPVSGSGTWVSQLDQMARAPIEGMARFMDSLSTRQAAAKQQPSALTALGSRPDVPFDIETGVSDMTRLQLDLTRNRQQQEKILRRTPGVQDVRWNAIGEPVITLQDPRTGQPRDILANPVGLEKEDFLTVLAQSPEIIFSALAARTGVPLRASGVLPILRQIGQMALGAGLAGAAKDVAVETGLDRALPESSELKDIAKERAWGVGFDVATGLGESIGSKLFFKTLTPFGRPGHAQFRAVEAQRFLRGRGIDPGELSPAEMTGSGILLRGEAFQAQQAGASQVFEDLFRTRREQMGRFQEIAIGTSPDLVPGIEEVGQRVLQHGGAKLAPLDWAVSRETAQVLRNASQEIEKSLRAATQIPFSVKESAVGGKLLETAHDRFTQFHTVGAQKYGVLPTLEPRILDKSIPATPLAQDAAGLLEAVASVEKQVQKPTGVFLPSGQQATQTVTQREPFTAFVSPGTLQKLEQLSAAKGGMVSYKDLIELRRDLDEEISRGSVLGGIPERRLQELRSTLTTNIRTGLDNLGGKPLVDAWEEASEFWAKGMQKFKDVDIINMFKDAEQRGSLGLNQVVQRALNDQDMFRAYRDFYGDTSNEYNLIKRIYADRIVGHLPGARTVDAQGFVTRLEAAFREQPETAEAVFGNQATRLQFLGKAAEQAGRKSVDVDALAHLIDTGTLTNEKLIDLIAAQDKRALEFRNEIKRRVAKGNLEPESIAPTDVVDFLVFREGTQPKDLAEFYALISDKPEILEEVKQNALLRVFAEATGGPSGKETLTPLGLDPFLAKGPLRDRLEMTVGRTTMENIAAVRDFLEPQARKESVFRTGGTIAAGMQVSRMEKALKSGDAVKVAGELSGILKSFVLTGMYLFKPVRNFIGNTDFAPGGSVLDTAAVMNTLIASTPFIQALIRSAGPEYGRLMQIQLKEAVDGMVNSAGDRVQSLEQALQPIQANTAQPAAGQPAVPTPAPAQP